MTGAFKSLIKENVLGEHQKKIVFFISMSVGDRICEIENYSAELLNSTILFKEFLKCNEIYFGSVKCIKREFMLILMFT